jgi:hypothetical protein
LAPSLCFGQPGIGSRGDHPALLFRQRRVQMPYKRTRLAPQLGELAADSIDVYFANRNDGHPQII